MLIKLIKNALSLIDIYKLYIKINHCSIKFYPKMHPYMNLLKKISSYYIIFITVNFYNFSKKIYFNKIKNISIMKYVGVKSLLKE